MFTTLARLKAMLNAKHRMPPSPFLTKVLKPEVLAKAVIQIDPQEEAKGTGLGPNIAYHIKFAESGIHLRDKFYLEPAEGGTTTYKKKYANILLGYKIQLSKVKGSKMKKASYKSHYVRLTEKDNFSKKNHFEIPFTYLLGQLLSSLDLLVMYKNNVRTIRSADHPDQSWRIVADWTTNIIALEYRVNDRVEGRFNLKVGEVDHFIEGVVKTTSGEPKRLFFNDICSKRTYEE